MEKHQINTSSQKVCRLCAFINVDGFELSADDSGNYHKIVKTICGYLKAKYAVGDGNAKWLCTSCHGAGLATIDFLRLVESGQKKLKELFQQSNKIAQKKSIKGRDFAKIRKKENFEDTNSRSRIKANANITRVNESLETQNDTPPELSKRQRRPPKRLMDELSANFLQRKKFIPIVITPAPKKINPCTLITSESIAEIRSAAGEALGEVIEVTPDIKEDDSCPDNKTYIICEYCKATFAKRSEFLQHITTHKICIYECSQCLQNFKNKLSFDKHQDETGHEGCGIIEYAGDIGDSTENFGAAPVNVFDDTNGRITPAVCHELYNENDKLQQSEVKSEDKFDETYFLKASSKNSPTKLTNSKYACSHCSKTFSNLPTVRRHYLLVHVALRAYKCDFCAATFKTKYSLKIHLATHTGEKLHSCNFCEKTFITKHAWQIHTRIHTGEKPFKCKDCMKTFATRCNLITHRRVHTGERPYKCAKCERCFKSFSNLKKHGEIHLRDTQPQTIENLPITKLEDTQQCRSRVSSLLKPEKPKIQNVVILPSNKSIFEKSPNSKIKHESITDAVENINTAETPTTSSIAAVKKHPRNATASNSTYRFHCSICFKQFNHCSAFKKHQRTHTGERPYKCRMCPKAFADPTNFKRHKMLHKNATYALKLESEKQKIINLGQLLDEQQSALGVAALSPTSVASDPDPDGLEVLHHRLDAGCSHSFTELFNSRSDEDYANIITDQVSTNEENFVNWNTFNYSLLQPNVADTVTAAEDTENKLLSSSDASLSALTADNTQLICISYQDPNNPVGKTTTFYAIN